MTEDALKDEKIYDEYFKNIDKDEIPVPEELEERILNRISSLEKKRHYGVKAITAVAAVLMLLIGGIRFNSGFAAYASSIPGLDRIVGWIRGDIGIQNARDHGYKELESIIVEEDGLKLTLSNILMDEDRITFSAVVSGSKLKSLEGNAENTGSAANIANSEDISDDSSLNDDLTLSITFPDFSYSVTTKAIRDTGNDVVAREVEQTFRSDEIDRFLENDPEYIRIDAEILKGREILYTFNTINLPFDQLSFKPSMKFQQYSKIVLDHMEISLNELKISPTRMKLNLRYEMEEGYSFTGFENPRLEDSKGNVYKPEGLISMISDHDLNLYFVPSLYFDRIPKGLRFCFDGIRIASHEAKTIRLRLDEEYPKVWRYMGCDIVINNVLWQEENKKLILHYTVPETDKLNVGWLSLIGHNSISKYKSGPRIERDANGNEIEIWEAGFEDIEKSDIYEIGLEWSGYLIEKETSVEINTN